MYIIGLLDIIDPRSINKKYKIYPFRVMGELNIKKSWNEVSISMYHDYLDILDDPNFNDFDKRIRILELFTGVENGYFDNQKPKDVQHLFDSLNFLLETPNSELKDYYIIGNKKYKLIKQVSELTAGQFVDLENANQKPETRLDNLHISLSAVLLPCKELTNIQKLANKSGLKTFPRLEKYCETPLKETQENIYKNCSIADAFAISVFFCTLFKAFTNCIQLYLAIMSKNKLAQALKKLRKISNDPKIPQDLKMKMMETEKKILSEAGGIG